MNTVTIIDYGLGNLWSVASAFQYLGCSTVIENDPAKISEASVLILPGVGSFKKGMELLRQQQLEEAILHAVRRPGSKILGICLGMQLLGSAGSEEGETPGLGLVPQRVDKFVAEDIAPNKLPHVGFNSVEFSGGGGFYKDLHNPSEFYFTHSYRMETLDGLEEYGTCRYGPTFLASFRVRNIFAAQFHPEKSQTNGLVLLKNFLSF